MKRLLNQAGISCNWIWRHVWKCHRRFRRLLWARGQEQRENANREKYNCTSKSKRERTGGLGEQSSLHLCELEAKKETECVLFFLLLSKSSALALPRVALKFQKQCFRVSISSILPVVHFTPWPSRNLKPRSENPLVYLARRKSSCSMLTQSAWNAQWSWPPTVEQATACYWGKMWPQFNSWKSGSLFLGIIHPSPSSSSLPPHLTKGQLPAFNFLLWQPFR